MRGTLTAFLKDALPGCPPLPISTEVEGACAGVVSDVFCVKLEVTGEEPLNPTLVGFFSVGPSAGSPVAVCVCVCVTPPLMWTISTYHRFSLS